MKKILLLSGLLTMAVMASRAESLTHTFTFSDADLQMRPEGAFTRIEWAGLPAAEWEPGQPWLPAQVANIALPGGASVIKVSVTGAEVEVGDVSAILPFQPPVPLSEAVLPDFTEPDAALYGSDAIFPPDHLVAEKLNHMRRHAFVPVRLHPLRWHPLSGRLMLATSLTVRIDYEPGIQPTSAPDSPLAVGLFRDAAASLVANPEDLDEPVAPLAGSDPYGALSSLDYLIITDTACSNVFQQLADYRAGFNGWSTRVRTVASITNDYSGVDTQARIKACIVDHVDNHGLTFVVLGGDDTLVPDRNCYVTCGSYTESAMPTDLYYSGLDSTWDEDGDLVYGEADYSGASDEGDLAYDVIVGRIPVRTAQQATDYINKVIGYESTNRPDPSYYHKVFLGGEYLWTNYTGTARPSDLQNDGLSEFQAHTPVSDCEIWMRRMYRDDIRPYFEASTEYAIFTDTLTSWDTSTPGDYLQSQANFQARLNEGWHIVNIYTHGNWNIWGLESSYFYNTSAAALTNLTAIVYTEACITGQFDGSDPCLSEGFLRNPNGGAIIYIGSSRYGWGSPGSYSGGTSAELAIDFYDLLFHQGIANAGLAFAQHKAVNASFSGSNGSYRWLQFSVNLQGDPGLTLGVTDPSIVLTQPLDGAILRQGSVTNLETYVVDGTTTFTSATFTANGSVIGFDDTRPFQASWTPAVTGAYDLQVTGHDLDGYAYTSNVARVSVVTQLAPSIALTNPANNTLFDAGDPVSLGVSVTAGDGVVTQVVYLVNGSPVDIASSAPWAGSWTMLPGAHALTAIARDDLGLSTTSAVVTIHEPVDPLTELFDDSTFDLDGYSLTFTPDGTSNYTACLTAISALPHDRNDGAALDLPDDGSSTVMLFGYTFPFFGINYGTLHVNANGNISFTRQDYTVSESAASHFAQPRISLFFDDLNPASGGVVRQVSTPDKFVVTFDAVPEYGVANANTGQIEIFADGTIRLSWLGVDLVDSLAGLSGGGGIPTNYVDSDLSLFDGCILPALETSSSSILIAEGCRATVGVRLNQDPGTTVLVSVTSTNGDSDITIDGASSCEFHAGNWSTWQTVTFAATEDPDTAPGTNSAHFTTPGYTAATVLVIEVDNDDDTPDADVDDLPDWWELQHFGCTTNGPPDGDTDGDGLSNRHEWIGGTDPTNGASFFGADPGEMEGGNHAVITWSSRAGRAYEVYCSSNLASGFNPVATNIPASPPVNSFTDTVHSLEGDCRYYRVRARLDAP